MSSSSDNLQRLRRLAQERGTFTRPELAEATGLSLVTVNRLMLKLCREGTLEEAGQGASGGGRPARLYRFRADGSCAALFRLRMEGHQQEGHLELLNMEGRLLQREQAHFSHLTEESLDDWLDEMQRQHSLRRIVLQVPAPLLPPEMERHLSDRYACSAETLTLAQALADAREGSATLCFEVGQAPVGAWQRQGCASPCGSLALLPLPASWERMDYSDHTLLEEMISRLLLMLTCTLAPERFVLHAPFWTPRLLRRIRFNASAKLRGHCPALHFLPLSEASAAQALQRAAWKL